MNADITRGWIVANVIALAVSAGLGVIGYSIRKTLGADTAAATLTVQSVYVAAETVISVLSFALYARLTSAVLVSVVPALSQRAWLNLHLALGVVVGFCVGLISLRPDDGEPLDLSDMPLMIFIFCMFAAGGGVLGIAEGGLQALVLRPVAQGLRLWIVSSAVATSVLATTLLATYVLFPEQDAVLSELVVSVMTIVSGAAGAVIMVPAVQGLRPRSGS